MRHRFGHVADRAAQPAGRIDGIEPDAPQEVNDTRVHLQVDIASFQLAYQSVYLLARDQFCGARI